MGIQKEAVSLDLAGRTLTIETGSFAHQANGSVTVRYGDTVVLVTATMSSSPRPGIDFFPLTVDFEERMYAAGKIPGSRFIRRETRPSEKAILTGRLIDRSIRPRFPKDAVNDVQVIVTTFAVDGENEPDIAALIGASAALVISDIPFVGPISGVKIGMVDGDLVVNPTHEQTESGQLELVVASGSEGVMMIEAGASQIDEETMAQAIELAHRVNQSIIALQNELREKVGKAKVEMLKRTVPQTVVDAVQTRFGEQLQAAVLTPMKGERNVALDNLRTEVKDTLAAELGDESSHIGAAIEKLAKKYTRQAILGEGKRPMGAAPANFANSKRASIFCHALMAPAFFNAAKRKC